MARPRKADLTPSDVEVPPANDRVRLFSASRLPLPRLDYKTFDGALRYVTPRQGHPVLLNLWASWCAPCIKELGEFARQEPKLREAGLDIVAVSVDGVGDERSAAERLREFLESRNFPFPAGVATVGLLDKLQMVNNELFDEHRQLPLPTSILIDPERRLAAIYKGALDVDTLVADVVRLPIEGDALRDASLPFEGVWFSDPRSLRLLPMAWELITQSYLEDGLEYVSRNTANLAADPEYAVLLARAGYELLERGRTEAAAEHYRLALEVNPGFTVARLNLAVAFLRGGEADKALVEYREAVRRSPDDVRVLNGLARLLATCGDEKIRDGAEAVRWAEKAAAGTARTQAAVLDTLAAGYAEAGRFDQAVATAETAIQLARAKSQTELAREIQERLRLYRSRKPYHSD